jgi:Zn-dependent protease with chaperone function
LSPSLKNIQANIVTAQYSGFLEQLTQSMFGLMISGMITITPERMPQLYMYIDDICKAQSIKTPTIIITKSKRHFNASACKLLSFAGFVCIGQQLILELSDKALEAVVAHELGHIKNNHNNKKVLIGLMIPVAYCIYKCITKPAFSDDLIEESIINYEYYSEHFKFARKWLIPASFFVTNALFSRSMERQADEFAYKTLDQGDGLIEFLEKHIEKETLDNQNFVDTYSMLQIHRKSLSFMSYLDLALSFWATKLYGQIDRIWGWIRYPCDEARIAAIREYQESVAKSTDSGLQAA